MNFQNQQVKFVQSPTSSGTDSSNFGNMETDRKFLALVMELIDKAQNSHSTCTSPAEEDLDSSRVIEKFLPAATHNHSRRAPITFIECLRDCFKNPNSLLMDFMLETKRQNKVYYRYHYCQLYFR